MRDNMKMRLAILVASFMPMPPNEDFVRSNRLAFGVSTRIRQGRMRMVGRTVSTHEKAVVEASRRRIPTTTHRELRGV